MAAMGDRLVEQRQRVAHRAFGDPGDQRQRLGLGGDAFGGADLAQMGDHPPGLDAPQIEADAARAHGDRHFLDLGGREQELDVLGRLLERLQQAIEGLLREHVHFVDDIDLGARRNRAIARVLDDLAHVVDAGMGGGVHLDHVDVAQLHDRLAMDAELGHVDARPVDLARQGIVEGAGQDARRRRLADAAHAGQDIGLVDAAGGEGIGERAHHRLLADQVLEAHGPVFPRQHPIGLAGGAAAASVRGRANRSTAACLGVKGSMSAHLISFARKSRLGPRRRTRMCRAAGCADGEHQQ